MTSMTPFTTLSEKSADISKWFDELVSSIRVEEMQIVDGIAPKEKQDFWKPFLENNMLEIAHKTRYIDVIIGGHSHSMITNTTEKNAIGKPIVIAQMGKSGLYLGRVDLELQMK